MHNPPLTETGPIVYIIQLRVQLEEANQRVQRYIYNTVTVSETILAYPRWDDI